MYFINRNGLTPGLRLLSFGHPVAIAELVSRFIDNRRSIRRHFHHKRVRICFEKRAPPVFDFVFIKFARLETGNEKLPNSGTTQPAHSMSRAIPGIKISDDTHRMRRLSGSGVWELFI